MQQQTIHEYRESLLQRSDLCFARDNMSACMTAKFTSYNQVKQKDDMAAAHRNQMPFFHSYL